jgi:hypothetical protein
VVLAIGTPFAKRTSVLVRNKETTMRLNKILSLVAVVTLIVVASAPASAQGSFSVGYSKFGKHSAFGVGIHSGGYYPRHGGVVVVDRHYVPGHYETRASEVWVPGCTERVWIEPRYQTVVLPCGNVSRVLVREGHFRVIQTPGRFETRYVRVWVPGYYV